MGRRRHYPQQNGTDGGAMSSDRVAKLVIDGKEVELPIIQGTETDKAIDISSLRAQTGYVTLDSAFVNTASCSSEITFLDGETGILQYRGYPIEELAELGDFMAISYLLLYGDLPTPEQKTQFEAAVAQQGKLPKLVENVLGQYPSTVHPMGALSSAIVSLSPVFPEFNDSELTVEKRREVSFLLMAQIKNIIASQFRISRNEDLIDPNPKLNYAADFGHMMFGKDIPDEVVAALNVLLILHADHEQNCSTSTVRLVGSSRVNPFAAIASGVNALWGPLHGGANQAVIEMLEMIEKEGGNYKVFMERAKDKNDSFRLMGFGHRVYKNFDPRARIIKSACDQVLDVLGIVDPLLDIAKGLEDVALNDSYFVDRKLYPNVDFYSGIIYKALGIPTNMFTAMFALGRLPGWIAQWDEMLAQNSKIGRPRQIFTGKTKRSLK